MKLTDKNMRAVKIILTALAQGKCSVIESREILNFAQQFLEKHTIVQDMSEQIDFLFFKLKEDEKIEIVRNSH